MQIVSERGRERYESLLLRTKSYQRFPLISLEWVRIQLQMLTGICTSNFLPLVHSALLLPQSCLMCKHYAGQVWTEPSCKAQ